MADQRIHDGERLMNTRSTQELLRRLAREWNDEKQKEKKADALRDKDGKDEDGFLKPKDRFDKRAQYEIKKSKRLLLKHEPDNTDIFCRLKQFDLRVYWKYLKDYFAQNGIGKKEGDTIVAFETYADLLANANVLLHGNEGITVFKPGAGEMKVSTEPETKQELTTQQQTEKDTKINAPDTQNKIAEGKTEAVAQPQTEGTPGPLNQMQSPPTPIVENKVSGETVPTVNPDHDKLGETKTPIKDKHLNDSLNEERNKALNPKNNAQVKQSGASQQSSEQHHNSLGKRLAAMSPLEKYDYALYMRNQYVRAGQPVPKIFLNIIYQNANASKPANIPVLPSQEELFEPGDNKKPLSTLRLQKKQTEEDAHEEAYKQKHRLTLQADSLDLNNGLKSQQKTKLLETQLATDQKTEVRRKELQAKLKTIKRIGIKNLIFIIFKILIVAMVFGLAM